MISAPPSQGQDCTSPNGNTGEIRMNDDVNALTYCNATDWVTMGASTDLSEGLIGYWTLDEVSGSSFVDNMNGYNGTWTDGDNNDITEEVIDGQINGGITFDGIDDALIIGSDVALDNLPIISSCAWLYRSTLTSALATILNKSTNGTNGWNMYISANGRLGFYTPLGGYKESATNQIAIDTWVHVCTTWDGSAGDAGITLYRNGQPLASGGTGFVAPSDDSPFDLQIGDFNNAYSGRIDDVRLYNHELSAAEVNAIYRAGIAHTSSCSSPTGLRAELRYNSDFHVIQYCNGNEWVAIGQQGDGGAPCTAPPGLAGELRYNADLNVLQYCEGDEWVSE